jgi:hypothetical protein
MPELERQLQALAAEIAWPAEPDLSSRVRARVREGEAREREPRAPWLAGWRRPAAIAFAVLVVAVAAAMAVPQARTAIFRWLGLTSVRIVRVEKLPPVPPNAGLDLGDRVTLEKARSSVRYHVYAPEKAGQPDAVYLLPFPPGGQVSFVWGSPSRPRLLFSQFRGGHTQQFIEKQVMAGTKVDRVTVDGEPGFWLSGEPHEFNYVDAEGEVVRESIRLAGNTLIWEHDGLVLRLEGRLDKGEALQLAKSVR